MRYLAYSLLTLALIATAATAPALTPGTDVLVPAGSVRSLFHGSSGMRHLLCSLSTCHRSESFPMTEIVSRQRSFSRSVHSTNGAHRFGGKTAPSTG